MENLTEYKVLYRLNSLFCSKYPSDYPDSSKVYVGSLGEKFEGIVLYDDRRIIGGGCISVVLRNQHLVGYVKNVERHYDLCPPERDGFKYRRMTAAERLYFELLLARSPFASMEEAINEMKRLNFRRLRAKTSSHPHQDCQNTL